jgi:hypothetical protein
LRKLRLAVPKKSFLIGFVFSCGLLLSPAARAQVAPVAPDPKASTAGTGASRTLDYFSTLNMRRRGRQEIFLNNDTVDNHAAFAAIEAAGTGVSIGAAYLFHRTGHHKLERWTSVVHISVATTGAVRNYCLKTAHPATTPTP